MLVHSALFVLAADRLSFAQIVASSIDACLIQWTVGIAATSDQLTFRSRITLVSRQTFADGPMIDGNTLGLWSTRFHRTGRHTLPVVARVLTGTLIIRAALQPDALRLRITVVTLLARADRFVVLHTALRIRPTVARIPADAVNTRRIAGAVRVRNAAGLDDRFARTATTANVPIRARTVHGAYR
uniref:Putative secreted protein n=1 Tax=Anopheles darlingi TaxID=43151 RepID=A0A2M4D0B6_ANODA